MGEGWRCRPPLPCFENRKKCYDFGKKDPDCVHLWVTFSIQNVTLGESWRKTPKFFNAGPLFLVFFGENVYQRPYFQNHPSPPPPPPSYLPLSPYPKKILVAHLHQGIILFVKSFILNV